MARIGVQKFALTLKGADVRLTNHDELEVKSMNVKCSVRQEAINQIAKGINFQMPPNPSGRPYLDAQIW
jgi:hypothetical protein